MVVITSLVSFILSDQMSDGSQASKVSVFVQNWQSVTRVGKKLPRRLKSHEIFCSFLVPYDANKGLECKEENFDEADEGEAHTESKHPPDVCNEGRG